MFIPVRVGEALISFSPRFSTSLGIDPTRYLIFFMVTLFCRSLDMLESMDSGMSLQKHNKLTWVCLGEKRG